MSSCFTSLLSDQVHSDSLRFHTECQQLTVKQATTFLTSFPRALEQVDGAVDPFPVPQVEKRVRDRLTVPALQDVLRRKYQRLHLQQILHSTDTCAGLFSRRTWTSHGFHSSSSSEWEVSGLIDWVGFNFRDNVCTFSYRLGTPSCHPPMSTTAQNGTFKFKSTMY